MKRSLLTLITIITTGLTLAVAQQKDAVKAPDMPIDPDTKLITYTAVVEVKDVNKAELYRRALGWYNTFYKNPAEVIREKDSVNFKIIGKPRFKLYKETTNGGRMDGGLVQ